MWEPWIGSNFEKHRIMILGESCYDWMENEKVERCQPDHPIRSVEWMRGDPRNGAVTLRKITRAICNDASPSPAQSSQRWHDFAYTNYIPTSVGLGRKRRPSETAWRQADDEWPLLLQRIQPRFVLVLGKGMWSYMPSTQQHETASIQGYEIAGGRTALCFAVRHPAFGHRWSVYAAWIAALEKYAVDGDMTAVKAAFGNA